MAFRQKRQSPGNGAAMRTYGYRPSLRLPGSPLLRGCAALWRYWKAQASAKNASSTSTDSTTRWVAWTPKPYFFTQCRAPALRADNLASCAPRHPRELTATGHGWSTRLRRGCQGRWRRRKPSEGCRLACVPDRRGPASAMASRRRRLGRCRRRNRTRGGRCRRAD